ncbi:MAG: hypothetical protein HWE10_08130 [Gammaproteobacteria bacterium]|nr:hypothetical protein [Gammaproteobacteria bacterium]
MGSIRAVTTRTIATCFLAGVAFLSSFSQAQQARLFSTEGYCILAFEQVERAYLLEYEKRLGFRPKVKLCNRVNRLVAEFQPASWDYQFGQPYPGSSIYITPEQVERIHSARERNRQARR